MGKGSARRKEDVQKIRDNWDAIFGKKDKTPEPVPEKSILEQHPYLTAGFAHFKDSQPMVYKPEDQKDAK